MKKNKAIFISVVMSLALIAGFFTMPDRVRAAGGANAAGPTDGLVAYWSFDGNYEESVNGLTTNLGAKNLTYVDGIYGKAAVFNGKDNYLYVDPDPILNFGNDREENNDNFTLSAWVNLGDSVNNTKYLLDKGLNKGWDYEDDRYWTNPYALYFEGCDPQVELSNEFEDNTNDSEYKTEGRGYLSGKYVEGQEWLLLTVTYDGKRIKVYRDNELLNQLNYTNGITFNNEELYIGVDHALEHFFKGMVDDLRLYNTCLSYDDVDSLYQAGLTSNKELVEPTKQMVAYYPFDDNLNDESTFKNNAEKVAIGGTTKYVVGKNGKAITMSKGNYILVPAADQLNFDSEYTVSFWIKMDKDGEFPVLYRQNPSYTTDNDNDWTYNLYMSSWGDTDYTRFAMSTYVYDSNSWSPATGQSLYTDIGYDGEKLKSTDWMHVAFTYQDGQLKSYLNGELLDKSETSDLVNIANASGDLLIGYDGDTFISGAIDELKIFNKCLTETEINDEAKRIDTISLSTDIAKKAASIGKGKTVTISSILLHDVDADTDVTVKLSNKNITFKSSNSKIFKVTADGKITGVKAGKAKLTITYGCHSVTYNVTIR